jgi:hypothetical protein
MSLRAMWGIIGGWVGAGAAFLTVAPRASDLLMFGYLLLIFGGGVPA